uniref:Uncharacterized protein n=1 Tax=Aegilops tauschii subsp. strangulata TaxID=200361 RepID=A0A453PB02_AEGTS
VFFPVTSRFANPPPVVRFFSSPHLLLLLNITMAVQAQYPSNLLFHDRGDPERADMDLPKQQQHQHQQQLAGLSPAVYFASGGASGNRRKRAREAMAPPPPAKEEYINLFAQQSAPFFNMAQLHNSRVASSPSPAPVTRVSTGLRLALDEQQQRQINSLCYPSSSSPLVPFSDEFAGQMKQHGDELDKFVRDQVIHLGSGHATAIQFRLCARFLASRARALSTRASSSVGPSPIGCATTTGHFWWRRTSRPRAGSGRRRWRRSARRGAAPSWRSG